MSNLPIILAGQVYLDEVKNEYLIVSKSVGGAVSFSGNGFRGLQEAEDFVERVLPVDPADVSADELASLLAYCPPNTTAKVGFVREE